MAVDWDVTKTTHACSVSGRPLEEGETYFSALQDEGKQFVRYDFSPEAWAECDKAAFFSYWRTTVRPAAEKRRLVIDVEAFYIFFSQLVGSDEDHRQLFLYLVALILVRKRVLRLEAIEKTPEGEFLALYDRRAENDVRVRVPDATDDELREAQASLDQIFDCQTGVEL